uniref:WAP domain-containing protein n=1 Tax=Sinocyclocheilus rhinocerous TaxID=307959 RepID=A0A673JF58_9TELE
QPVCLHIKVFILCVLIWFPCCACIKEKPGVCPSKNLGIGVCAELCSHDSDCPNDEKCCSNGCGHQCMKCCRTKCG